MAIFFLKFIMCPNYSKCFTVKLSYLLLSVTTCFPHWKVLVFSILQMNELKSQRGEAACPQVAQLGGCKAWIQHRNLLPVFPHLPWPQSGE